MIQTAEAPPRERPERWTELRYHTRQRALWNSPKRFRIVAAGRGSGKTELAKRFLVRYLPVPKPWPDPRYFFGGPTREQAKRIAWKDLKALVPPGWIARDNHGIPRISEVELTIETIFGSSVSVFGLDKPERVCGLQWDGCVLDESSDLKPGIFDTIIYPALTHRNGWCWRIGVPRRYGVGVTEFRKAYEKACAGEDRKTEAFNWPSADILPKEAIQYAREHMDPVDFREQFEATFETAGGRVFHAFDHNENVRPCSYDPKLPLIIGSDFNVDPMAWVIGHRRGGNLEWVDEIWLRDTNTQKTLDVLYRRYDTHAGGFRFFGDAAGRRRETSASESDYAHILNDNRFKRLGRKVFYPHSNPHVEDRLASCNAMLCNAAGVRRMHIDPHCKHLIDDLQARSRKPGSRDLADTGDMGHITDAMGYAVHAMFPMRQTIDAGIPEVMVIGGGYGG